MYKRGETYKPSNPLLYSSVLQHLKKKDLKRVWGLFKGGVIRLYRTFPSQYWLVPEGVS
jgi:hypothetical protein